MQSSSSHCRLPIAHSGHHRRQDASLNGVTTPSGCRAIDVGPQVLLLLSLSAPSLPVRAKRVQKHLLARAPPNMEVMARLPSRRAHRTHMPCTLPSRTPTRRQRALGPLHEIAWRVSEASRRAAPACSTDAPFARADAGADPPHSTRHQAQPSAACAPDGSCPQGANVDAREQYTRVRKLRTSAPVRAQQASMGGPSSRRRPSPSARVSARASLRRRGHTGGVCDVSQSLHNHAARVVMNRTSNGRERGWR